MLRSLAPLALAATAAGEGVEANPIRRVVTLLQKMQEEVEAEGEKEEKLYAKFECFCKKNKDGMGAAAKEAETKIAQLTSEVEANEALAKQLEGEIAEAKSDRASAKESIQKATAVRSKEKKAYDEAVGDSQANIDALNHAVEVLDKGMGGSFLQNTNSMELARVRKAALTASLSGFEKEEISSFLGLSSPYGAYQASSGEIVGILKTMKDQMDKDLGGIVSDEEKAVKSFQALITNNKKMIKAASEVIERKQVKLGETKVAVVNGKNEVTNTKRSLSDNQQMVLELAKGCDDKAGEWATRQKTRAEEIEAITEAIKVLNDDDALDMFKKTLGKPQSFLQIQNDVKTLAKAVSFVRVSAKQNHNPRMSMLAMQMASGKVSFDKVLKMIDDMVTLLGKEQKTESKQRETCNSEIDTNEDEITELNHKLESGNARKEDLTAKREESEASLKEFQDSLKATAQLVAEATEQRKKEAENYKVMMAENNAALQLIEKAKNKLHKFYNPTLYKAPKQRELTEEEKIAQSLGEKIDTSIAPKQIYGTTQTVFMQMRATQAPKAPETWDGGYKNKGQKTTGVVALMDMLLKDLRTQITESEMEEKNDQKDYEDLMGDSKKQTSADNKGATEAAKRSADLEGAIVSEKESLSSLGNELNLKQEFKSSLHGSCDWLLANFDVRKEARANEAEALKNAKAVLHGATFESLIQISQEPAKEAAKDLEVNYAKIAPFGKEDTAHELQSHAAKTQDTLVDAVENAEVAEIKRSVFRSLTRLRAATIKEFDTIARLETQSIDAYNDAHHYRAENPLSHLHEDEAPVPTDKLKSFH